MLQPGERAILAYFGFADNAQAAEEELKGMGFEHVQVDRVSKYGVNIDSEYNNPLMGRAETNTGLVLYSANTDRLTDSDSRTLMSADTSVSGFASNGLAGGEAFMVTVVTDDTGFEKAKPVLEKHGGKL